MCNVGVFGLVTRHYGLAVTFCCRGRAQSQPRLWRQPRCMPIDRLQNVDWDLRDRSPPRRTIHPHPHPDTPICLGRICPIGRGSRPREVLLVDLRIRRHPNRTTSSWSLDVSPLRRTTHRRRHLGTPSDRLKSSLPPMGRNRAWWQEMGCRRSHRSRNRATASYRPQTHRPRPTIHPRRCQCTPSCPRSSTPMTVGNHPGGRQERGCRHSHQSRCRSIGSRVKGMRQPHRPMSSPEWGLSSRPHRCLDIPSDRVLSIPRCMGICLDRYLMGLSLIHI